MKLIFVVLKGSVINITSSPIRPQSNIGKVTVNFVSSEIVHMIEFLRMMFVLKKIQLFMLQNIVSSQCKEIRHVDMTIKQIRKKKIVSLTVALIYLVC